MSARFDNVSTFATCNFPLATNSCTNNCRNSICFVFRETPLYAVFDFADEESVYTVIFFMQCLINSLIVDVTLKASIVVMLIAYNSASQDDGAIIRLCFVWCRGIKPNQCRYRLQLATIQVRLEGLEFLFSVEF